MFFSTSKRHNFLLKGWPPGRKCCLFLFCPFYPKQQFVAMVGQKHKIVRTSTEISLQQVLRNSSKTIQFDNKIKTQLNHKKFTFLLNPSRQPRFRGKVNFIWSNLVLILLSKRRVLLLFGKTCWNAISVDVLTNFAVLAQHGHKFLFWLK